MQIDENEFRLACQLKDKDWLIERVIQANSLIFDGHALIKKAQIMIDGTMKAISDHQGESTPHTDADIKLYTSVASLIHALGWSGDSNRENE